MNRKQSIEKSCLTGQESPGLRFGSLRELTSASVRDENTLDSQDAIRASAPKPLSVSENRFVHTVPAHTAQALVLQVG